MKNLFSSFLILVFLTACGLSGAPALPTVDIESRATSLAATLAAHAQEGDLKTRQAQLTAEILTLQAPRPTSTLYQAPPTPTPTELITLLTLTPPTPPPSPTNPLLLVTALADTNCRARPEPEAERLGILYAGQQSTIHGRNQDNSWLYIENPEIAAEFCWVWSGAVKLNTEIASLPVITPAPPPSMVSFEASFSNVHFCYYDNYLVFRVENTGTETFYLAKLTIQTNKGQILIGPKRIDVPYMSAAMDCPPGIYNLESGKRGFIPLKQTVAFTKGARLQAIIELCTEDGPDRKCVGQTVSFLYP